MASESFSRRIGCKRATARVTLTRPAIWPIALPPRGLTRVPLELPPDALEAKAREVLKAIGHPPQRFSASGFVASNTYLNFLARLEVPPGTDRWARLESGMPAAMLYWHRQAPWSLEPMSVFQRRTEISDPPSITVGSVMVGLDTTGRLIALEAVPASWRGEKPADGDSDGDNRIADAERHIGPGGKDANAPGSPQWDKLFTLAGLNMAQFKSTTPLRTPWFGSDTRVAWEGQTPGAPEIPLRVEAAAENGRVTSFRVMGPWYQPERVVSPGHRATSLAAHLYGLLDGALYLALVGFGGVMAWRNVRSGKGDRRGATIVAGVACVLTWLSIVLCANRVQNLVSLDLLLRRPFSAGLWLGAMTWITYLALEPAVRRQWPTMLVGWVRMLDGRWRDARVRQEMLVGSAAGVGLACVIQVLMVTLDGPASVPPSNGIHGLLGSRFALGDAAARAANSIYISMAVAFLLAGFRWLVKSDRFAALAVGGLITALVSLENWPQVSIACFGLILSATLVGLLIRFGLVALLVAMMVERTLGEVPAARDLNAWQVGSTVALGLLALVPAVCAALRRPGLIGMPR